MTDRWKWPIVIIRGVGATYAIVVLTARVVYGAEASPIPDAPTAVAVIGAALVYMAKTIYELTLRKKSFDDSNDPRLNAAAWEMLTQHMQREEKLFEGLTSAQDRVAQALTQLALRIEK